MDVLQLKAVTTIFDLFFSHVFPYLSRFCRRKDGFLGCCCLLMLVIGTPLSCNLRDFPACKIDLNAVRRGTKAKAMQKTSSRCGELLKDQWCYKIEKTDNKLFMPGQETWCWMKQFLYRGLCDRWGLFQSTHGFEQRLSQNLTAEGMAAVAFEYWRIPFRIPRYVRIY